MTVFTDGLRMPAQRGIQDYESSLGEVMSATAGAALTEGPTATLYGINDLGEAKLGDPTVASAYLMAGEEPPPAPETPIDQANARVQAAGLDKILKLPGDQPTIKTRALDIMIDRARAKNERDATLARGPGGVVPGALAMGTSLLVGAVDPLNVAAAFIPVIGEARYAKLMASAGEGVLSRAAMRAGLGATTGAAFTAGFQPLEYIAHSQEGQDFGMADALRNIVYGAGTFGLLHVVGGAGADVYRDLRGKPLYPWAPGEPLGPPLPERVAGAVDARRAVFEDVHARLLEAGLGSEEAAANAAIVASRYSARAARLEGRFGDAYDLYRSEGIEVRGPGGEPATGGLTLEQAGGPEESRVNFAVQSFWGASPLTEAYKERHGTNRVALKDLIAFTKGLSEEEFQRLQQAAADWRAGGAPTTLPVHREVPTGIPESRTPMPADFPLVAAEGDRLEAHPDLELARRGDQRAAVHVVRDVAGDDMVERVRTMVGDRKPMVVAVYPDEPGRNKVAAALASYLSGRLGLPLDTEIVQANRPRRAERAPAERLMHRAAFDGEVRPGRDYLLVDDAVTQGGTLADLRSYIEKRGGRVIGAATLKADAEGGRIGLDPATLASLRQKFGDEFETWWRKETGHGFDALTDSEARQLLGFDSAEAARGAVAPGRQAGDVAGDAAAPRAGSEAGPVTEAVQLDRGRGEQYVIPGAGRESEATIAQRRADAAMRPRVAQKPMDIGLFGDEPKQKTLFQSLPQAPIFYSAVERAVLDAKQERATPEQWLGMLRNRAGVKPEEMEWLGLEPWLKAHDGPVTRQELADYIRANAIEVHEVLRGDRTAVISADAEYERASADMVAARDHFDAEFEKAAGADGWIVVDGTKRFIQDIAPFVRDSRQPLNGLPESVLQAAQEWRAALARHNAAQRARDAAAAAAPPAVYGRHDLTMPGGRNYREVLLTLPANAPPRPVEGFSSTEAARAYNTLERRDYRGPHWEEPNVVAHARFNDRIIDGKRTLFIEEIQSDWHRRGKKQGYIDARAVSAAEAAEAQAQQNLLRVIARGTTNENLARTLAERFLPEAERAVDTYFGAAGLHDAEGYARYLQRWPDAPEREAVNGYIRAVDERMRARAVAINGVPDAPFKTAWPELVLKRMIRYAAENGYDKISWTPGRVQADRGHLSTHIRSLMLDDNSSGGIGRPRMEGPFTGGHLIALGHDGKEVMEQWVNTPEEIANLVGGEVADRLLNAKPFETSYAGLGTRRRSLEGVNLDIGGEGLRRLYDKTLPESADKLAKRFGARVHDAYMTEKDVSIDNRSPAHAAAIGAAPVHALDITPALREAAVQEGFPLFQRGAGEPRGSITLSDNRAVISLFAKADASTFMHETGHLWLEELIRDAARAGEGSQLAADLDRVLSWLGVAKPEDIKTEHHEQWAQGFERYLAEGQAPSPSLAGVFQRFKQWLLAIYHSLTDIGVPLSDEVRGVMGRLLATDDELATRPVVDALAALPARAKEDVARAGIANLINGEPVRAAEVVLAAAQTDPRVAAALETIDQMLRPSGGMAPAQAPATPEPPRAPETPARLPFPTDFPAVVLQQTPSSKVRVREHPDYEDAEAGDADAAWNVVHDVISDRGMEKLRKLIGDRKPVLVAVHAEEASGRNKLPIAYAVALGERLGLDVDGEIVQANQTNRTGSAAAHRLTTRAEFDGEVESGRDYLLVDDAVTQGGTLADLRSYIEARGGKVIGATTLMGSPFSHILAPTRKSIESLREKLPDLEPWWKATYGHGFEALTDSELAYLRGFGSTDAIRDRFAPRGQAPGEGAVAGESGAGAEGIAVAPRAPRGPRARPPETWSLFEYIASLGGIDPNDPLIGDVRAILGRDNKFVPGFGPLVRAGGLRLDALRERAIEAGYLFDPGWNSGRMATTTVSDLLEALDAQERGRAVYRHGREREQSDADAAHAAERERAELDKELDHALRAEGLDPLVVTGAQRERVLDIMQREGIVDPHAALEREAMEWVQNESEAGTEQRIPDHIPGWDLPAAAGPAPAAGGPAAPQPEPRGAAAGEGARPPGGGDREAEAYRELSRTELPEDDPDTIAASKAAHALPELPEPGKRLAAALESEKQADEIFRAMEPYFSEEERARFNEALATLDQEGRDAQDVLRKGAACLIAGLGLDNG